MRTAALALAVCASTLSCSAILGLQEPVVDDSLEGGTTEGGEGGGEGGACGASPCQPVLITDDATLISPYDMLVGDDGYLYFTNGNADTGVKSVARVDKTAAGAQPEILIDWTTHEGYPNQIALGGGNFFFAVDSNVGNPYWGGGIVECPMTGCPQGQGLTRPNLSAYAVASDGTHVVYADDYTDGNFNDYYELKAGDTNLQNTQVLISDTNGEDVYYLDIDSSGNVYAAHDTGIYVCNVAGCGGAPTPLLGALEIEVNEVRVAGDRLYFTSAPLQGAASVQWVPLAGGQPTPVTTNVNFPLAVVVDDTYVYFTDVGNTNNPNDGRVVRCPRDGCGPSDANAVTLSVGAAAGKNPRALAQDATTLYWGTYTGQVWKVAK